MKRYGNVLVFSFYMFGTMYGAQNLQRYIWAYYNQCGGNYDKAQQWYNQLFNAQAPTHIYKGYASLLFDMAHFQELVGLIPTLEKLFPQDVEVHLLIAHTYEKSGNQQKADNEIITLSNNLKNNQEIAFQAAQVYIRRKEPENALKVIDDLLNTSPKKPNSFIFHFLKAQIFLMLQKMNQALASVKMSLDLNQQFDKGWLLLALIQEQQGQFDEAIKGYKQYLELTGPNKEIESHIKQLMMKQKSFFRFSYKAHTYDFTAFSRIHLNEKFHPFDAWA